MLEPLAVTLLPGVFLAGLIQRALAFRRGMVDVDGKPPVSKALFAGSTWVIVIVWGAMVVQIADVERRCRSGAPPSPPRRLPRRASEPRSTAINPVVLAEA